VIVSSSVTLFAGGTIILGRKFSARRFWNDCVDYKVTVFTVSFYISVAGKEMTKI
jgi:fatty-acyl-CoA synthase